MITAKRDAALIAPTDHVFIKGMGYFKCQDRLVKGVGKKSCTAASYPADGSAHVLLTPAGTPLEFVWHTRTGSWMRDGGTRMAFTPDYLGSHGWTYSGPV